jgi:hypothetical protein
MMSLPVLPLFLCLIWIQEAAILPVEVEESTPLQQLHPGLSADEQSFLHKGVVFRRVPEEPLPTLEQMMGKKQGSDRGITFDFLNPQFQGALIYGFISLEDGKFPQPVFFKRKAKIKDGKAEIDILGQLSGNYDMVGWQQKGSGLLGYRVVDETGVLWYDGRVGFRGTGPFRVLPVISQGPLLSQVTHQSAVLFFEVDANANGLVRIADQVIPFSARQGTPVELTLESLKPASTHPYSIEIGPFLWQGSVTTAPEAGSRRPLVFAYASDCRGGPGGGERDLFGVNAYILKKILAFAAMKQVAFCQFTGDLIDGYLVNEGATRLQYANFKRVLDPFARHLSVVPGMGNHEVIIHRFESPEQSLVLALNRWPFDSKSSEALFAEQFALPLSDLVSEDGSSLDPNRREMDFPPYRETVFSYTYDNIAVIVLNSNYWFSPSLVNAPQTGGGLHGYIMDQQLSWLEKTLNRYERDSDIDHVFVTLHTPFFPNGGHMKDDMWYHGDNRHRPIAGDQTAEEGIIERRETLLDLLVNRSRKFTAVLSGDEHNYCRMNLLPETPRFPAGYEGKAVNLSRPFIQINNGAAGAPYYAQEQAPWSSVTKGFTTQNAVVLIFVEGEKVWMEAWNPDTLEHFDSWTIKP